MHYTFPAFHMRTKSASTHTVTVHAHCACSKNIAGRKKKVVSGLQENHAVHAPDLDMTEMLRH